jgi:hypothetical protein
LYENGCSSEELFTITLPVGLTVKEGKFSGYMTMLVAYLGRKGFVTTIEG